MNELKATEKDDVLKEMKQVTDENAVLEVRENMRMTDKGAVKNTVENYLLVCMGDPQLCGALRFNLLTERIDLVKEMWWSRNTEALTDTDEAYLYAYFEVNYSLTNDKIMRKALRVVADSDSYHPIREVLNGLEWDGQERVRYLLKKYLGSNDSDLTYHCLLHFMLGAVRRVFLPGCKYEEMLCLVGGQGAGKSTFFRFLAIRDEWFQDDLDKIGDKKVYEKLYGHWIIELSEMTGIINAKSIEEMKSFLSKQSENFRIAYDRYPADRPRQCVFGGTTNTGKFLPFDRTGARRFLPIAVDTENAEKHLLENEAEARNDIMQAWAEVMVIFRSGSFETKFPEKIQTELEVYRQNFMQEDTTAGLVQSWLDDYEGDFVCTLQLWREALDQQYEKPKRYHTNELAEIMNHAIIGWKEGPHHRFKDYGIQRSWVRESTQSVNEDVNGADSDGFFPITASEQMKLPFDEA